MSYLGSYLHAGLSESDVAAAAREFMSARDVSSFWYYDVAALVLVGSRTVKSISGKHYAPTTIKIKDNDIVTVDLSPELDSYWGDLARTFVIERGNVITRPSKHSTKKTHELFAGIHAEKTLHKHLCKVATPDSSFEEIYSRLNRVIDKLGYVNLDFKKNLGHSIEKRKEDRVYMETGCEVRLSEVDFFTFEPHIKLKGSGFGYKWEDIYYFSGTQLKKIG